MRVLLIINATKKVIPFDHQYMLVGTIHKWLGRNVEHGKLSLYSFSRLEGGKVNNNGILFNKGASFFFSSYDPELTKRLVNGIMTNRTMFNNLEVNEIRLQENPELINRELFLPCSPIFIKRRNGERIEHILYDDPRAGEYLKETLMTKMEEAG